jgi:Fic family protein
VADVPEVNNYVTALEYGFNSLAQRSLSLGMIREMHALLMKGVRGDEKTPGQFRKVQAYIAKPGARIEEATFVPPPPEHLQEALESFERFLHAPSELPPLIRLALIHYQFEAIHPFNDGNGRLGRMLITLLLSVYGLLSQPILYLSDYLEKHRQEYYSHLLAVSQKGMWTQWATFFLNGIAEKAIGAVERGEKLLEVRQEYQRRVQSVKASARLLGLVDHLFASPMIKTADAERVMKVTRRAAQSAVDRLVSLEILKETTGRSRDRIFEASAILRVIESDTDAPPG